MSKPTHEKLFLGDIEVPAGRRSLNEATVRDIADSMRAVGQLQPITVIDTGESYRLISGAHRVAAARLIADAIPFEEWEDHPGIGSINAIVLPYNWDGNPRLIEISENLHRAELTALERSELTAEWLRLTTVQSSQPETIESRRSDGRGHRPQGGVNAAARELGISKADAHRAVKVAALSPEAKEAARDAGLADNQAALLDAAKEKEPERQVAAIREHSRRVMCSSESVEWYSPPHIVDIVTKFFGAIDIDPCWHPDSPVLASATYTQADDGLSKCWAGRVYMNPPYGRTIDDWIAKLVAEHDAGNITEAVALVPARVDTEWFRRLDAFPRCFVRGRITFSNADNPAPYPHALIYLGRRTNEFSAAFACVGETFVKFCPAQQDHENG